MKPTGSKLGVVFVVVALAALTIGLAAIYGAPKDGKPQLLTAAATRGDIVQTVDATGTLQAVTTVQVGTQVSGTIKTLHADFNSTVRKGQALAELDTAAAEADVEQARASVVGLQAQRDGAVVTSKDADVKLARAKELAARQLIPAVDLETAESTARGAQAAIKSADAQVVQARAALDQNQVNLRHAVITSPIDGIVISRAVDVGQTVAASMQAPTLFVIAQDLRSMQVNASVDESDIGRIAAGQHATFTVDAYPDETFSGTVSQVRLQPVVDQNVVSYTTVIDVRNDSLKLKPGMTAQVKVETARADGVIRVPASALRFQPDAGVLHAYGGSPAASSSTPAVWILQDGKLTSASVVPGTSDGRLIAITQAQIPEGAQVVTGAVESTTESSAAKPLSSPLTPSGGPRRM